MIIMYSLIIHLYIYISCFFFSSFRVIVLSYYNFTFSSVLMYVVYEIKEIIIILVNVGNNYN